MTINSSYPLVSVVIPVYNVEKYLEQCIQSVLSQSYKNLEIILFDDGSTDRSGSICDKYAKENPEIRVIHKNNEGLGMARNTGIDISNGDFLFMLDSDDYIDPEEIENQYRTIAENNVDAVYLGYIAVDEDGKYLGKHVYKDEVFVGSDAKNKLLPKMLGSMDGCENDRIEMAASPLLYSMRPIREHNLRFVSERDLISEDFVFNIDYLEVANGACTCSRTGCYYRQVSHSLSHKYREDRFEKFKTYYEYIQKRILGFGFSELDLKRYDKTFLIQVRSVICLEISNQSPNSFIKKYHLVRGICNDELVQTVVGSYPTLKMNIFQRLYVKLLKHKLVLPLMLVLKIWSMRQV